MGLSASAAETNRPDPIQPADPPSRNQTPGSQEGKGFFERRRLSREFKAEQGRKRKAFNKEDDARRKKTEWRFE